MSGFSMTPAKALAVLASGALFGFGLSVSTMVRPEVVLGFLRFNDLGLMLVMGGAVAGGGWLGGRWSSGWPFGGRPDGGATGC